MVERGVARRRLEPTRVASGFLVAFSGAPCTSTTRPRRRWGAELATPAPDVWGVPPGVRRVIRPRFGVVLSPPRVRGERARLCGAEAGAPDGGEDFSRTRREGCPATPRVPWRFDPPGVTAPPRGPGALRRTAWPRPDVEGGWPDRPTRPELSPPRERARCSSPAPASANGNAISRADEIKAVRRTLFDI